MIHLAPDQAGVDDVDDGVFEFADGGNVKGGRQGLVVERLALSVTRRRQPTGQHSHTALGLADRSRRGLTLFCIARLTRVRCFNFDSWTGDKGG